MKFLSLKTKFNKGLFFLGLITAASITENTFGALHAPQVINGNPEAQIGTILERCLFAQQEKKPFSFYIDELIRIVTTYKNQLETKFNTPGLASKFIQDMQSIRNSKNPIQIGKILSRYKTFMPASLKQKKIGQLLSGLKFRLAIADDGSFDEVAATASQGYLNILIGYYNLLLESTKKYFSRK